MFNINVLLSLSLQSKADELACSAVVTQCGVAATPVAAHALYTKRRNNKNAENAVVVLLRNHVLLQSERVIQQVDLGDTLRCAEFIESTTLQLWNC